MRPLILSAALALASCGGNGPVNNAAVTAESEDEDVTAVNDVTAIDAATGEAAEMAADVNYTFNDVSNETADNASANAASNSAE